MEYFQDKAKGINIAYIGGGSRGWAWDLMKDLALEEKLSGNIKLYDLDYDLAYNNEIIGNALYERKDVLGKWKYKAVKTLEDALKGADFVIISIMVGTFKEMESDVHAPEKYGIYQAVGDTVGPGGLMRALRTIPVYIDYAEKIKKYCPDAWVINYTNPMTLCTRILYKVFPEIKAFGCCHEVFSTQFLMADVLSEMCGINNVPRENIKVNVKGINHFTWLDKVSYEGIDLIPLYDKFIDKYFKDGYYDTRQKKRDALEAEYFGCWNKVKFDLFKRYGMVAAAGDRHLAEFMPPWYLKNPETVKSWKFGLTPVTYRINKLDGRTEKSKKLSDGKEQVELKPSGEEGVSQIKALLGLGDLVTNVNLPNKGQLEGFPRDAVVETNAVFRKNSIQPVLAGGFPEEMENLIIRHVYNQETILKAAINKDKALAFKAFVNDPLVNIHINDAEKLFGEMLANTKKYLSGWDI
jgi:galacturan 1,4-alpha-galacturonidase